jgi:energy-coupling factor transporter ATP-binding protein EcfA2
MAIIEFKNYSWRYLNVETPALSNINLSIEQGEFIGVIGPNGSGKTTLCYSINGLIPDQYNGIRRGEVLVFGKEVTTYPKGTLQRRVGLVFSDPEVQFTSMTVEDEIVFGLENLGMSLAEIRERLEWVMGLVHLKSLLKKPPYELSGGQKQQVALASVIAMTPDIMIFDEPTSMLDPINRMSVFNILEEIRKKHNSTVIVVEHSLEKLVTLADRMLLLYNGQALLFEETRAFFQNMPLILEKNVDPPGILRFFYELTRLGDFSGQIPLSLEEAESAFRDLVRQRFSKS